MQQVFMCGTIWRYNNDDFLWQQSDWSEITEWLTYLNCELQSVCVRCCPLSVVRPLSSSSQTYGPIWPNLICVIVICRKRPLIFTCVAEGESRSRSCSHSVRLLVRLSVRPKILSKQLLWNYWSNYHETWYVDRTSHVVMHIGRKFWFPHFCWSYVP